MPKQRDYAAEYARRIARNLARGLTRSQARGHAGVGQKPIRSQAGLTKFDPHLEQGVRRIRKGETLTSAAQDLQVTTDRLRRYITGLDIGVKEKGKWTIDNARDFRARNLRLFSNGETIWIEVFGYEDARIWGDYMNAVRKALNTNNEAPLIPFQGQSIFDVSGVEHPFETDLNTLYALTATDENPTPDIYRIGD